jgi:hypothetical protein
MTFVHTHLREATVKVGSWTSGFAQPGFFGGSKPEAEEKVPSLECDGANLHDEPRFLEFAASGIDCEYSCTVMN